MKVFLLEPNEALADKIEERINVHRTKMRIKKVQDEKEIFKSVSMLHSYSLFILNLKNPTDPRIMDFIRRNGGIAPILLILENNPPESYYKTVYYLGYNDIIVKDFDLDEMVFRVYKLCDLWNNDVFFLYNGIYFDYKHAVFINKDERILLGKKEALLLKYLLLKSPSIVSAEEIECFVYENEIVSQERIRSLVRQLRLKLPEDFIKTVKGGGYHVPDVTGHAKEL